jgi:DNA-binding transcriptional MerR regulator
MSSAAIEFVPEEGRLYRIGEVSRLTDLKPFVLRYWETEFPMLQPVKSSSGHRLYRQEDVDLVFAIKRLLYDEGFTIAGARRHLRDLGGVASSQATNSEGLEKVSQALNQGNAAQLNRKVLLDLRDALRSFLTLLEGK